MPSQLPELPLEVLSQRFKQFAFHVSQQASPPIRNLRHLEVSNTGISPDSPGKLLFAISARSSEGHIREANFSKAYAMHDSSIGHSDIYLLMLRAFGEKSILLIQPQRFCPSPYYDE